MHCVLLLLEAAVSELSLSKTNTKKHLSCLLTIGSLSSGESEMTRKTPKNFEVLAYKDHRILAASLTPSVRPVHTAA